MTIDLQSNAAATTAFTALVRGGLAPWQARRVSAHVEDNLARRIRTAELAQLVSLSESHFSRAFRATFGKTPGAYIAVRRMERAQSQMLSSNDALANIAHDCGLADQSHFTRMFRRVVGMSPAAWRRLCWQGPAPRDTQPRRPSENLSG